MAIIYFLLAYFWLTNLLVKCYKDSASKWVINICQQIQRRHPRVHLCKSQPNVCPSNVFVCQHKLNLCQRHWLPTRRYVVRPIGTLRLNWYRYATTFPDLLICKLICSTIVPNKHFCAIMPICEWFHTGGLHTFVHRMHPDSHLYMADYYYHY